MSDETAAAGGELDAAPVIAPANLDSTDTYSPEQALEAYQKRTNPTAESAASATADTQSADEADAAPPEEAHGGDEDADPAAEPPIERPKSWTESEDAEWRSTPRALQQKIVARELERDTALRRTQNEAAESKKAIEAELEQTKQATKTLAAKLPEVDAAIQEFLNNKYPDIKSMDDVVRMAHDAERLSETDPFAALQLGNRLKAWEVDQQRIARVRADAAQAEQNLANGRRASWAKFVQDESAAFAESAPEFKANEAEYTKRAAEVLRELGFTQGELEKLASGDEKIPLFDRRMQRLLLDRIRLSEIKAAPPKAIPNPVPAVQRPGVAPARGAAATENVQALRNKLSGSGSVDDAFALYQAKQRRRS